MMCLLHWVLAGNNLDGNEFPTHLWGPKPIIPPGMGSAAFSVLYSDVGDFYERCGPTSVTGNKDGWIMRGAWTTRWLPRKHPALDSPASEGIQSDLVGEWRWLDNQVLDQLWTHDNELMRSDLRESWHALRSKGEELKALFTFLPSGGVEGFQRGIRLRVFLEEWSGDHEMWCCSLACDGFGLHYFRKKVLRVLTLLRQRAFRLPLQHLRHGHSASSLVIPVHSSSPASGLPLSRILPQSCNTYGHYHRNTILR